jgi:hypothetical protein
MPKTKSQIKKLKLKKKDIWTEVLGMWKNKKPDPLKYLKNLRKEWDRINLR